MKIFLKECEPQAPFTHKCIEISDKNVIDNLGPEWAVFRENNKIVLAIPKYEVLYIIR